VRTRNAGSDDSHPVKKYRRIVRQGTERFNGDGLDNKQLSQEQSVFVASEHADDDNRIVGELPPHWGLFPAEKE
jgi:hypothetical protein